MKHEQSINACFVDITHEQLFPDTVTWVEINYMA